MKVLIVDDSPLMRTVLKDFLSEEGFEVLEAGTNQEAQNLAARHRPEVIVKDLFLPDSDAVESIRTFLNNNANVKIIICSTLASKESILEALKAGALDFILKPLSKSEVISVIKKVAYS